MTISLEAQLRKFEQEVTGASETVIRKIFKRASDRIIDTTPVDTGLAQSNWFAGLNKFVFVTTKNKRRKTKSKRIVRAVAKKFKLGGFLTLTNTLPYIDILENGHSKQAPAGMVKIVMSLMNRWIAEETNKITGNKDLS